MAACAEQRARKFRKICEFLLTYFGAVRRRADRSVQRVEAWNMALRRCQKCPDLRLWHKGPQNDHISPKLTMKISRHTRAFRAKQEHEYPFTFFLCLRRLRRRRIRGTGNRHVFSVVRPAVRSLLTRISRYTISLYLVEGFQ